MLWFKKSWDIWESQFKNGFYSSYLTPQYLFRKCLGKRKY